MRFRASMITAAGVFCVFLVDPMDEHHRPWWRLTVAQDQRVAVDVKQHAIPITLVRRPDFVEGDAANPAFEVTSLGPGETSPLLHRVLQHPVRTHSETTRLPRGSTSTGRGATNDQVVLDRVLSPRPLRLPAEWPSSSPIRASAQRTHVSGRLPFAP